MHEDPTSIKHLIDGVQAYQAAVHHEKRELFQALKRGQKPKALFITCSDSRIDPNLVTQTEPGSLFIIRNAGAIIPPYGATNGGEGATVEYALLGLEVEHIIVCGHADCGAMRGLIEPESVQNMRTVKVWLRQVEATRLILNEKHGHLSLEGQLHHAAKENVLIQIENLQTHPSVALRLAQKRLQIHGWMYDFETGNVEVHEPVLQEWRPLVDAHSYVSA